MFIQIHTLTSYHATLLNRDDAGLAKRIPFGDATRLRISSQCLKRHWRENLHATVPLPPGVRTRHFFEREILPRLLEHQIDEPFARQLTRALIELLLQKKKKNAKKSSDESAGAPSESRTPAEDSGLLVKQPILFGKPEADFLVDLLAECARHGDEAEKILKNRLKSENANFKAMLRAAGHGNLYAGIEGALFGRFVTSDILARTDAAVHVAHAFTIHSLDTEVDYFTVVDDLNKDEETGAAHAGDMELGCGLYYGYVAVDIPLLMSNLCGCDRKQWKEQDAADGRAVLRGLMRAIATVSPGAKLGATAPYAFSDFVLLESGGHQPRSLANAYLKALPMRGEAMQAASDMLGLHLKKLDAMYGRTSDTRVVATTRDFASQIAPTKPLDDAIETVLDAVFGS